MTRKLESYVCGGWVAGSGAGAPLHDPTTEAVLATASTSGLDLGAALAYARDVGSPALRELTFKERGKLLAGAAAAIHEIREELVELAIRQGGNTRGDAKFDIDGATATLAHYAELGAALGNTPFLVEDVEAVQIGRSPRLIGQHVLVSRAGVAVHINAFNFPAWGLGEKLAVALLGGMPVLTKPATSTAMVAERLVRELIDKEVLPPGALSLITGSAGKILDGLTGQDVLAFTGSSSTAATLRGLPSVITGNVRVNVEADSLNAAILAPDAEREGLTHDLFLREVARDMTQKAGQKCTAIRRIFVPRDQLDEVRGDLAARLDEVKVGDPSLKEVRMGPLATRAQLDDVRGGIAELARESKMVHGDGGRGRLVGVDGERGYFVTPTLLEVADGMAAKRVHELEVFGPVATIIPYDGTAAHAVKLVARGGGGLVASVYTDDRDFAREAVLGIACYHGRVNIGSDKVAEHSMGPGTVLPHLVHGGPGRAGGGEELGGKRGLSFYMQRTAIQGLKPLIEKILGSR